MLVYVNGEPHQVAEGQGLVRLLEELGLAGRRIAVALNHDVVPRGQAGQVTLKPDDRIEIVHAVQGG